MRVLLKLQAVQWLLLAISARIASSVYFRFELNQSNYVSILFLTMTIALFGVWANHIIKMKKKISIRNGSKVARIQTSRFILETFEGKNIQNALGVDSFKAIATSNLIFNLLKRICRVRHFDLSQASVIQKKEENSNYRFLQFSNRFYLIPDSETQLALVGFNGTTPVAKIDDKIVEKNTAEELLSVKRWAAYPVKETLKKQPSKQSAIKNGTTSILKQNGNSVRNRIKSALAAATETTSKKSRISGAIKKTTAKSAGKKTTTKAAKTTKKTKAKR